MDDVREKKDEEQAKGLSPEVLKQVKYTYANNTYFFFSNWDVRLVFAEHFPLMRRNRE